MAGGIRDVLQALAEYAQVLDRYIADKNIQKGEIVARYPGRDASINIGMWQDNVSKAMWFNLKLMTF